jgi:hypothetical protein
MQREKILTILLLSIIIVGECIIGIDAVPLGEYILHTCQRKMKKMNELFCTY